MIGFWKIGQKFYMVKILKKNIYIYFLVSKIKKKINGKVLSSIPIFFFSKLRDK